MARFRDDNGYNVVDKFKKLQQTTSIDAYVDEFECLRGLMLQRNPNLSDDFFLDNFVGGIKTSLKPFVRAFKPTSMAEAIEYARLQEESLHVSSVKPFTAFKPSSVPSVKMKDSLPSVSESAKPPSRTYIPAAVRAEKMAKGECYYCNQPWDRNHKCPFKKTQLFTVEVLGEDEVEVDCVEDVEVVEEVDDVVDLNTPCISVNALSGSQGFQTMRVLGSYGRKPLHILVDSGSTHNFLDLSLAQTWGCPMQQITPQAVAVADGNHLACQYTCKDFTWVLQGHSFTADVMLIPLGSCDMVLGVQWLSTLGSVLWNFKKLVMEFQWRGKSVKLHGIPANQIKVQKGEVSSKVIQEASHICLLQVVPPERGLCRPLFSVFAFYRGPIHCFRSLVTAICCHF
ncbi:hypothetical protein RND81_12G058100 [Saponaria officinalis]|uniref:Retrotransposon gag domain-containing protein n=1 Tax=Saponaria officinalis TaxID=3572 RepID=A0AAW1H6U7_SAPOF